MPPSSSATEARAQAHASAARHGRELLARLSAFEAELEVLEHRLAGSDLLLWPLCRFRVFEDLLTLALGTYPTPAAAAASRARRLLAAARHAGAALRRDPLRMRGRFDVLIFGSTLGVSVQREGKWFGRINDHFALEFEPQTLVLDQAYVGEFRTPRYPRHVAAHDALMLRAQLRGRLRRDGRRLSGRDQAAIAGMLRLLRERLPGAVPPETLARVELGLRGLASSVPALRDAYKALFERSEARMLFLEDASFTTQAYLLKWAAELGVRSGEFQHGVITDTVSAYNHPRALCDDAGYRQHLPEFLLTYGEFWNQQTQTPSQLRTIGNPHFELKRTELRGRPPRAGQHPRTLLFISQPDAAADLVPVAAALSARLRPDERLVYRLHPAERADTDAYRPLSGLPNVQISASGDVYEQIHAADEVIGASSTALFEAAGLGKPVHVYATPTAEFYVPPNFGRWFADVDALSAQLAGARAQAVDPDHYFAPDWRTRYRNFVEAILATRR